MTLNIRDLQHFQAQHPDYRLELVDGEIIVIYPTALIGCDHLLPLYPSLKSYLRQIVFSLSDLR